MYMKIRLAYLRFIQRSVCSEPASDSGCCLVFLSADSFDQFIVSALLLTLRLQNVFTVENLSWSRHVCPTPKGSHGDVNERILDTKLT